MAVELEKAPAFPGLNEQGTHNHQATPCLNVRKILGCVSVAATALVLHSPSALAKETCQTGNAHYEMLHYPGWTAGFQPIPQFYWWPRNVALFVRSAETGKTYWFIADQGNSPVVYLYSTKDVTEPGWRPRGPDSPDDGPMDSNQTNRFLSADHDLKFLESFPDQTDEAPSYLLLPDLPQPMWYLARESMPLDFFKLVNCD